MKKLILFSILILIFKANTFSQFQSQVWLGGNVDFSYSNQVYSPAAGDYSKSSMLGFNVFGGIFKNDFLYALGMEANTANQNSPTSSLVTSGRSNEYNIYPLLRFYTGHGFFIHFQISLGELYQDETFSQALTSKTNVPPSISYTFTSYGIGVGLGYSISAGEHFAIEPMVKYYYKNYSSTQFSGLNFTSVDWTLGIGVVYKIKKKVDAGL